MRLEMACSMAIGFPMAGLRERISKCIVASLALSKANE